MLGGLRSRPIGEQALVRKGATLRAPPLPSTPVV